MMDNLAYYELKDRIAEADAKLERVRVIVAASVMKWTIDEEFDRQYELEQLQAQVWEVVR